LRVRVPSCTPAPHECATGTASLHQDKCQCTGSYTLICVGSIRRATGART
jgi:hypothetical protein